jgi:hypothetical protein
MGKAAKTRAAEFRKKAKRSEKERQRALYESYKKAGSNRKSKIKKKGGRKTVKATRHAATKCGNVGCNACFPHLAHQRMNDSNDPRVRFCTLDQILKGK